MMMRMQKQDTKSPSLSDIRDQPPPQDSCDGTNPIFSSIALQNFLDRIPISLIPLIHLPSVLELKAGDYVIDALRLLYDNNVLCSPITDDLTSSGGGRLRVWEYSDDHDLLAPATKFTDCHIGFVDFPSILLWCLEATGKWDDDDVDDVKSKKDAPTDGECSLLSILEQSPCLAGTKLCVVDLAKSFVWQPFFPVHLEVDTFLRVLLLLSKHPLSVLPAVQNSGPEDMGFITQHAVVHLLLQSNGLEWFDRIADKTLSEFCFEKGRAVIQVYADQCIAEALEILWRNRATAVAVVERGTRRLIGMVRRRDIHLLLDHEEFFTNRRTRTVAELLSLKPNEEQEIHDNSPAGSLRLRDGSLPRMDSPVIHQKTDSLKQAMKKMVNTGSESSFLVDGSGIICGTLNLRDIILVFAPPGVDSRIDGGSFFDSALKQVGCRQVRKRNPDV